MKIVDQGMTKETRRNRRCERDTQSATIQEMLVKVLKLDTAVRNRSFNVPYLIMLVDTGERRLVCLYREKPRLRL
ncbi:hypothetical protein NQ315_003457 [Exocentrus adspersus]|uniref:Uncharacterized protein n=1 Tax=Exocentrus adspersus TaxID=1586481 RepID=A0AAV8V7P5_9CUCU|nr:hypothetical protein NQ315_003457 [Exocentrus adspersus]